MPPSRLLVVVSILCAVSGPASSRRRAGPPRRSPHASLIDSYYRHGPAARRYSDNVLEDAVLDVPELVRKYGYPFEEHKVTTEDGYILGMHRIPHGRHQAPDPNRPVVFVMHGLLVSSACWILMGPRAGLGYILADAGYDVWLGNARGNYYSRKHSSMDPDNHRHNFWQFSWDEIGRYDLPAMIDHALQTARKSRLHYVGHSQGTTAFWTMASLRPEYNAKIIAMQAFAPVAFMQYNNHPIIKRIAPFSYSIESLLHIVGVNELTPSNFYSYVGQSFCSDNVPTQPVCSNILYIITGKSDMFNATMFPVMLGHCPAGASVRQLAHYGQLIGKPHFRRYDHGIRGNRRIYRSLSPPSYNLSLITAPVFLHYCDNDLFAHVNDVDRLWRKLGRPIAKMRVPHATFSHLDFMFGTEAKRLLYDRTIDVMRSITSFTNTRRGARRGGRRGGWHGGWHGGRHGGRRGA